MPEDDAALKKLYSAPRLTTIKYTCRENDGPLNSIQLLFDKGWKAPVYQTEDAQENKCKQGTTNIDPNKVIGKVCMLVRDGTLNALEIISIKGDIIADCVFNTGLYGNWEVRKKVKKFVSGCSRICNTQKYYKFRLKKADTKQSSSNKPNIRKFQRMKLPKNFILKVKMEKKNLQIGDAAVSTVDYTETSGIPPENQLQNEILNEAPLQNNLAEKRMQKFIQKQQKQIQNSTQIQGLGTFRAKALEYGRENIKADVDRDIDRMRERDSKNMNYGLQLLLVEFKERLQELAQNKVSHQLPSSVIVNKKPKQSVIKQVENSKAQSQSLTDDEEAVPKKQTSIDTTGWLLSGQIKSVGEKLKDLTNEELSFTGIPGKYCFNAADRIDWSSPLSDDGTDGINFSRILSVADSQWLIKQQFDDWKQDREYLSNIIGPLSNNTHDEYFNMTFKKKQTVIAKLIRIYEKSHNFALLEKHWRQHKDKYEVGYMLSGLMSWLNDQRIANLYVFVRIKEVKFYKAMQFYEVSDQSERARVLKLLRQETSQKVLMSIRLPDWHNNEPFELEIGNCKIPTLESTQLRALHTDLIETGAIHLIRHIAMRSHFKLAHELLDAKAEKNPQNEALSSDQEQTPPEYIGYASKVMKIPEKALFDPYQFNPKWKNGHHFNAIQMHSKAALAEFINPSYSGTASHLLWHSFLLVACNTSAVFLIENQSAQNDNLKAVLRPLSTNICAGDIAFGKHRKSHAKSMAFEYFLSPDLLEYREWLRVNKYCGVSRKANPDMLLKQRQTMKKDIAVKLLRQGSGLEIASSLAKLNKNTVLDLKKNMSPVFKVTREDQQTAVFKIQRSTRQVVKLGDDDLIITN